MAAHSSYAVIVLLALAASSCPLHRLSLLSLPGGGGADRSARHAGHRREYA